MSRLLELARADVMQPLEEQTELAGLLYDLQQYYQDKIQVSGNAADTVLPLPADITRTILGNLIENSFQHGATEIAVEASTAPNSMTLILTDNGRGISAANAEKLFTPFFTTKRDQGGTGLGLVVIRSLLAAYRGKIRCIPTIHGACFEIRLPLN